MFQAEYKGMLRNIKAEATEFVPYKKGVPQTQERNLKLSLQKLSTQTVKKLEDLNIILDVEARSMQE